MLTNTLESITDGFYTLDHEWRFTFLNKEAERLLCCNRSALIGKIIWAEFPEMVGTVTEYEYLRAIQEQRTVVFETFYAPLKLWIEVRGYPSEEGLTVSFRDISGRKRAEDHIEFLALYDPLTWLPNRRLLLDRLRAMTTCHSRPLKGAVLFLDLDNFKTLNDTRDHDVGDQLLQHVASRLTACVRDCDTVARFGGDEFVVILEALSEESEEAAIQAETTGEKILATLKQPYWLAGHEHHSTASFGIMLFEKNRKSTNVSDVMKRADLAMHRAKAAGGNTLRLFDPAMQATINAHATLEAEMRRGLRRQEFLPYFQPHVDSEGRLRGAEALARWQHPQRGLIPPR